MDGQMVPENTGILVSKLMCMLGWSGRGAGTGIGVKW